MTWRVNEIFIGSYVSLSDVLQAQQLKRGDLKATGSAHGKDKTIVNVVPLFDDLRIQRFLQRYAPSLLECTSSFSLACLFGLCL